MEEKDSKIRYPIFTARLSKDTILKLKDKRKKSGLSWNLFILNLLENNGIDRPTNIK